MAQQYLFDSIHTKSFTPQEFQVELLNAAKKSNIIVCLSQHASKTFIALKLIQESAVFVRRSKEKKFIVYVLEKKEDIEFHCLRLLQLTDLSCEALLMPDSAVTDFLTVKVATNVLVMTYETLFNLTCIHSVISAKDIYLLILDECHLAIEQAHFLSKTMPCLLRSKKGPDRILGLTSPLFISGTAHPGKVEAQVKQVEKIINAKAETASEIVSALRYCSKPKKFIVEFASLEVVPEKDALLDQILKDSAEVLAFLEDHRYDPGEIYDKEFIEEIKEIPDPKADPIKIINDFLGILHTLGLWCADKAALLLYFRIEKLKVKTPYERHYLLLCLVSSFMLKTRALLEEGFESFTEKERIFKHSTSKILRLIEIIRQYKPVKSKVELEEEYHRLESLSESQQSVNKNTEGRVQSGERSADGAKESKDQLRDFTTPEDQPKSDESLKNGQEIPISKDELKNRKHFEHSINHFGANSINGEITSDSPCAFSSDSDNLESKPKSGTSDEYCDSFDGCTRNHSEINKGTLRSNKIGNPEMVRSNLGSENSSNVMQSVIKDVDSDEELLPVCDIKCISKTNCDNMEQNRYQSNNYADLNCIDSSDEKGTCLKSNFSNEIMGEVKQLEDSFSKMQVDSFHDANCKIGAIEKSNLINNDCNARRKVIDADQLPVNASKNGAITSDHKECNSLCVAALSDAKTSVLLEAVSDESSVSTESSKQSSITGSNSCNPLSSSELSVVSSSNLTVIQSSDDNHQLTITNQSNCSSPLVNPMLSNVACDSKTVTSCLSNNFTNVSVSNNFQSIKWLNRRKNWRYDSNSATRLTNYKLLSLDEMECMCGLMFVEDKFMAKVLFHLLNELRKSDEDFWWLAPQYTVCKSADPIKEPQEADMEHQKQEEVLKRFRMKDCNILIGTAVLEEGIDLPKCNLVIRFDPPMQYKSYALSRCRARATDSSYFLIVNHEMCQSFIRSIARYLEIDQMLLNRCTNIEPSEAEEKEADLYNHEIGVYQPIPGENSPFVSLNNAISVINRYCAKLPSDTFTRLVPLWNVKTITFCEKTMYYCTVQLPINSPVKHDIVGHPMPTPVLARRVASLEACRVLHQSGELDDSLQPIGKESFRLLEGADFEEPPDEVDQSIPWDSAEPRPGTTKRRQYYYKRIASAFNDCRPGVNDKALLYFISMTLTCPIPEEQNTRGRRLHPPENSPQGFGILTLKPIPRICSFPIFTRCGEVEISLRLCPGHVQLDQHQLKKITTFIHYTFTNVLRLQKYLMMFDPAASENSFFIVPTREVWSEGSKSTAIDWEFLDVILEREIEKPQIVPEEERVSFKFMEELYADAVVTPWYRNQDQPQYFYAAEICYHLNPQSLFPGSDYKTFEEYYQRKYSINIQNKEQPLLDVDHTSARLNFLTPRYVNRKGVALPTSSEETKRAKRENLEQKQILVPELCMVHPFPASLWRKAVSLPCILYRINALLLADEIRALVAKEIALGSEVLPSEFEWSPLDFGWRLSDVLKKSREEKSAKLKAISGITVGDSSDDTTQLSKPKEDLEQKLESLNEDIFPATENLNNHDKDGKIVVEDEKEKVFDGKDGDEETEESEDDDAGWKVEIGTWSNDMAEELGLPPNVTMIRYGSPTSWHHKRRSKEGLNFYDGSDSDDDDDLSSTNSMPDMLMEARDGFEEDDNSKGLKIEFKNDYLAEALETDDSFLKSQQQTIHESSWKWELDTDAYLEDEQAEIRRFEEASIKNLAEIESGGMLVKMNEPIKIIRPPNRQLLNLKFQFGTNLLKITEQARCIAPHNKEILENSPLPFHTNSRKEFNNPDLNLKSTKKEAAVDMVNDGINSNINCSNVVSFMEANVLEKKLPFNLDASTGYGMPYYLSEQIAKTLTKESSDSSVVQNFSVDNFNESVCSNSSSESQTEFGFSFDFQPNLENIPGPNPSLLLQALTMSNANDGINLERLETIGDSFLKYAITIYLYCTYENIHEGKLSHLRSKQVSNLNLYRLGKRKVFGESMIATKFEPHDNWLPPCYYVPRELERALIEVGMPASSWNQADLPALRNMSPDEIREFVEEQLANSLTCSDDTSLERLPCFVPYNLITQHSIPDKSIADCVEALIGAYLIACGPRGALLFMSWLGIKVLPCEELRMDLYETSSNRAGCMLSKDNVMVRYTHFKTPSSPLIRNIPNADAELNRLLDGFDVFENHIQYRFLDRSYLLQAMTHASYFPNRFTDCYQRLEFLGDAVLDYLITRHLYEDKHRHSPGELTDLRSALVNNTIFASLAVRHGFHKFFRHLSPGLAEVVERFVRIQEENGHSINEEYYLIEEEECEEVEDVEVPKALGDVFESVAGAVYLDSNMSLDKVWDVYYRMMRTEIEQFTTNVPKSPIRELLELEPETAKFSKPEKLTDGRRVRVTVEVFGKGAFKGIGRNYRIAKCTAAKCALRQLKKKGLLSRKVNYMNMNVPSSICS